MHQIPPSLAALCHLASWFDRRPIPGGWAFEQELRASGLLDYSFDSLGRIDAFLDQLRERHRPEPMQVAQQASWTHLIELLAFYTGELISRANTIPVAWRQVRPSGSTADPFGKAPSIDAEGDTLTCFVREQAGSTPQPFWPQHVLMRRLFESTAGSSIRVSASALMHQIPAPSAGRRPLPALPPRYLPFDIAGALRQLSPEQLAALRIHAPSWMADDPLRAVLDAEPDLLRRGCVTWGAVVHAHPWLFRQRWHQGAPAEILFDPMGRLAPEELLSVVGSLRPLRQQAAEDPQEQAMSAHLRSDTSRALLMEVPRTRCSYPLRLSSTYVDQLHLPDGTLARRCLPILVDPSSGLVKPLPFGLWPRPLVRGWMDSSQALHGRRLPVSRLRSEARSPAPDTKAVFQMALRLYRGDEQTPPNPQRAHALWLLNAQSEHAASMYWLGKLCRKGEGVPRNPAQAFTWFQRAASAGDAHAMVALAQEHMAAHGVEPDLVKAEEWLRHAASLGNRKAVDLLHEGGFDEAPRTGTWGRFVKALRR